ncbi:MAG: ribosomal-protein-alanine N-acetyltransferase [Erysipelotrichaceae bacterium]|nr:ribosomal-protein-alanine N-acetyltransferase [Erysipelotrichaceae bacterium]
MIRKMTEGDLDEIDRLEKELFSSPWPREEYIYELKQNPFSNLIVIEEDGEIAAYCDWWIIYEQAQIATIGVREKSRRKGYGQMMIDEIVKDADAHGCDFLSLEVRVSNTPAIRLYEKNGFIQANIRKNYYEDNHEDAYLMIRPLGGGSYDEDTGN